MRNFCIASKPERSAGVRLMSELGSRFTDQAAALVRQVSPRKLPDLVQRDETGHTAPHAASRPQASAIDTGPSLRSAATIDGSPLKASGASGSVGTKR